MKSAGPIDPIDKLEHYFRSLPDFEAKASHAIRQAFDDVIDGARTGRWSIDQLESTEKTYIGTKVEIIFRDLFDLGRGESMDNRIAGEEVDTKWSEKANWMIPKEAVGHICLVITGSDKTRQFSVGIVRVEAALLNPGENRDGKKTLSKAGRRAIRWIVQGKNLEPNFFAELKSEDRDAIFSAKKGQPRVNELFRRVQRRLIPRYAIALLGQQDDPMKRARDARKQLKKEKIEVLNGRYQGARLRQLGFRNAGPKDWLSIES